MPARVGVPPDRHLAPRAVRQPEGNPQADLLHPRTPLRRNDPNRTTSSGPVMQRDRTSTDGSKWDRAGEGRRGRTGPVSTIRRVARTVVGRDRWVWRTLASPRL